MSRARAPQPEPWQPGQRFRVGEEIKGGEHGLRPQAEAMPQQARMFEPPLVLRGTNLIISGHGNAVARKLKELGESDEALQSSSLEAGAEAARDAATKHIRVLHVFLDSKRALFAADGTIDVARTCDALSACNIDGQPMRSTLLVIGAASELSPETKARFELAGVRVLEWPSMLIGPRADRNTYSRPPLPPNAKDSHPKAWGFDNKLR
ncbi:MAG: hypothetical protein K1X83_11310 [Oligoflexia bacterium]|nr:hypothetical protein [Oligoflexia bacterium]